MKPENINQAYSIARERYAGVGVDTEKVLTQMQDFHLSMHCWQSDDVKGFEVQAGALSGGIQSTGNYPGAARNIDELRADILKAKSLIPGSHRLNLHEIYGDFRGKVVDRDILFCALAGLLWYSQFFGLSLGKGFLSSSPVLITFSWCILMALNVTFSNVWGIVLKEWKGCSRKTVAVLLAGIAVLVFSTFLPQMIK